MIFIILLLSRLSDIALSTLIMPMVHYIHTNCSIVHLICTLNLHRIAKCCNQFLWIKLNILSPTHGCLRFQQRQTSTLSYPFTVTNYAYKLTFAAFIWLVWPYSCFSFTWNTAISIRFHFQTNIFKRFETTAVWNGKRLYFYEQEMY